MIIERILEIVFSVIITALVTLIVNVDSATTDTTDIYSDHSFGANNIRIIINIGKRCKIIIRT